jgi:electron transfer flavoprotein alpha subunit
MSEILVLIDHVDGEVKKPTYELLTIARRLGEPSAVFIGDSGKSGDVAEKVKRYGAEKVYVVDDAEIKGYLVAPKAEALEQLCKQLAEKTGGQGPAAILVPSSYEGKEVAARLAIKLESGLITDAVDVQADEGGAPVATQSVFAGNFTVTSKVTHGTPIITVKPNAAAPEEAEGAASVEEFAATVSDAAKTAQIVATQPRKSTGRPELTESAIVVSGGRGTGGDFEPIENFADALGAAVGASRAAVDSGWVPHSYQVGQTGKTVSPQLYIAAGISGAIQHRAGMQTSKTIVAVNKDEEAPLFELVDFGVVGDLHKVLPAATEEINRRKG